MVVVGVAMSIASKARARIRHRDKTKEIARGIGMSHKAYRASRWASVGWSYAIETIRRRCKKSQTECTIKPSDLSELWEKQNQKCPLTGWIMMLRKSGAGLKPETVTVDRINQAVGYVTGNIRLVAFAANNARYIWGDDDLLKLSVAIVANQQIRH